jgi:hypothetical protein
MIRLIALVIIGIALVSCASGSYEANVGKAIDMIPEWAGGGERGAQSQAAKKSDAESSSRAER